MDLFSDAELAFLERAHTPARMAIADPNGTPHVIPVDWSLSADQRSIELGRTDLLAIAAIDLDRIDTAALVVDVVDQSGRSQGIELTGPVEPRAGSSMANLRPARVVAWGFEGASDGAREIRDGEAEHHASGAPRADKARNSRRDSGEGSRFQPDPDAVTWRMRFRSPPEIVYRALTTDEGRASFWTERSVERGNTIAFEFPGGVTSQAHVLETEQDRLFRIDYFGAVVAFELEPTRDGGTDLRLLTQGFAPDERTELMAGWLNVLFPLKAFVDYGVDLRNHDPDRTWRHGYADQ